MTMIRRIAIGLAIAAGLFIATSVALFAAYDFSAFQSRREEIRALGLQTPLPASLTELMRVEYEKNGSAHITARILINELAISRQGNGELGWHSIFATWTFLAHLHLSEQEQYAIIAANSYMGHGRFGYAPEAQARFGKPISSLNDKELATLIVLTRSPSRFEEEPELLQISRDELLSKVVSNAPQQAR